jgi:SAM-dependent methyltransferase
VRTVDWLKTRFGRTVLLHVRPRGDRLRDEPGFCSACGAVSVFAFNSWVIPEDLQASWNDRSVSFAYLKRESLFCRYCCSSLRVRRIASVLVSLYGESAKSMAELVLEDQFRRLDIAEINTIGSLGSLHVFLSRLPHLAFSEYRGSERLGELVRGVRNEDICRLTYPEAAFDLVLSSDTLEHVPDFEVALKETRRVLRPGGRHVFTVPIVGTRSATEVRARLDSDGHLLHVLPPLYHGRGAGLFRYLPVGDDLLTFTEFGRDLTDHMQKAGFEPEVFASGAENDESGATLVFAGRAPE